MTEYDDEKFLKALRGDKESHAKDNDETFIGKMIHDALTEEFNYYKTQFEPSDERLGLFFLELKKRGLLVSQNEHAFQLNSDSILKHQFKNNDVLSMGHCAAANNGKNTPGIEIHTSGDEQFTLTIQPSAELSKKALLTLHIKDDMTALLEGKKLLVKNNMDEIILEGIVSNGEIIVAIDDYSRLNLGDLWQVIYKE